MKTLVLANQKGGVGKSAVATLLVHYFGVRGYRVLAVDLDHQGNLSKPLRLSRKTGVASTTADQLFSAGVVDAPIGRSVLLPSGPALLDLERQPTHHVAFARRLRSFLAAMQSRFDVCVIDTHPNPDIRLIAALASADFVLSPIQLNQEALDGVVALLEHPQVGLRAIKAALNPKLQLIGLLPTMVEATPFHRNNLVAVVEKYAPLLIPLSDRLGHVASLPRRSAIAEAQSAGEVLWEMKKTAARDAWREIEPSIARIADTVVAEEAARAA